MAKAADFAVDLAKPYRLLDMLSQHLKSNKIPNIRIF